MIDTSDEWIQIRPGIKERRIPSAEQAISDLAEVAGRRAMENAKIQVDEIDLVLIGTIIVDIPFPSAAVLIQNKLGLKDVPCLIIMLHAQGHNMGLNLQIRYSEAPGDTKIFC
jgi:3-oxoacyl-[acyl-carrier-protein] synthase-3